MIYKGTGYLLCLSRESNPHRPVQSSVILLNESSGAQCLAYCELGPQTSVKCAQCMCALQYTTLL